MLRLVGGDETEATPGQVPADAHETVTWRAIDVGNSPEVGRAVRRLRRAAQRALRRDTGGVRNFRAFAIAAAIGPEMAEEAIELEAELKAIAAGEALLLGAVSREVTDLVRALRSFLALHGRPTMLAEVV